jgi:predicted XRE-type DNA-binding protein
MDNTERVKTIYEELAFPDAPEMLIKAQLVIKIAESLHQRGWSQQYAAKMLGLTQPKLSKMLRGQFRGISEIKMMDCLTKLGREVKILIGPETESSRGRVEVVAA